MYSKQAAVVPLSCVCCVCMLVVVVVHMSYSQCDYTVLPHTAIYKMVCLSPAAGLKISHAQ